MDGFDRIYDLHRILKGRKRAISAQSIMQQMECSRATFNRIKRHMVDFLGAPIEYDREQGGYRYSEGADGGFELPGIWFNEQELHSLLLMQQLLDNLGVGLLKSEIYPIRQRIEKLINKGAIDPATLQNKVRFVGVAIRDIEARQFQPVADAIVKSQSLTITYTTRDEGRVSEREISPQRLINYQNNWYVDAWCHMRKHFRTFAVDCISNISRSKVPFRAIDEYEMDRYFQAGYGIYAGSDIACATIRFAPEVARRIAKETWHPKQRGQLTEDGYYELTLPFNVQQPYELIMDVVKFGAKAEIVSPAELRQQLLAWLTQTAAVYQP